MKKQQNIELARIVGACGIVFYHSGVKGEEYFYSALVVFIMLSAYISGKTVDIPLFEKTKIRFERLLVPWMFWFLIYGLANLARGKPFVSSSNGWSAGILAGPSDHLWYMPFIFACLVIFDFLKRHLDGKKIGFWSGVFAITMLATSTIWREYSISMGYPWAQYFHACAAIGIGIFMLYAKDLKKNTVLMVFSLLVLSSIKNINLHGIGIPYLIGVVAGIVLIYCADLNNLNIDLGKFSGLTLGIYFVHKIFLSLLKSHFPIGDFLLPCVAFLFSALFVWVMQSACPRMNKYWS